MVIHISDRYGGASKNYTYEIILAHRDGYMDSGLSEFPELNVKEYNKDKGQSFILCRKMWRSENLKEYITSFLNQISVDIPVNFETRKHIIDVEVMSLDDLVVILT